MRAENISRVIINTKNALLVKYMKGLINKKKCVKRKTSSQTL